MDAVKKNFLQACMNFGYMSMTKAENFLKAHFEAWQLQETLNTNTIKELVDELNESLKDLNQKIAIIKHPLLDEELVVFAITVESEENGKMQAYSELERLVFGKLLDKIMEEEEYGIPYMSAYDVLSAFTSSQKSCTKQKLNEIVENFVVRGYFVKKNEMIYLGPRLLVEFNSYLRTNYPDLISECPLCKELVFWDIKCSECDVKIHKDCIRKYLSRKSNCPSCKKTWNTPLNAKQ